MSERTVSDMVAVQLDVDSEPPDAREGVRNGVGTVAVIALVLLDLCFAA